MLPHAYRDLLRRRELRRLIGVGMIARLPNSGAGLVVTFHIVETLHRTYAEAGAVVAVFTVGVGIGAPWRGRLVDRLGLRRAVAPSVLAQAVMWPTLGVAPFWALFPAAFVGGLFALPTFSVIRKALSVVVEPAGRRTAFALDSVGTEIIFMVGPAVGVWCASETSSTAVLIVLGAATAAGGALLWLFNPPMSSRSLVPPTDGIETPGPAAPRGRAWHGWMTPSVAVVLAVSLAAAVALAGTDVGVLAEVRGLGQQEYLGLAYAVWCASSAVGGLVYGALHRPISPVILVLVLGLATAPLTLSTSMPGLLILLVVAGFACAPVMVATADALTRLVVEERRGEAMGWQGSAFTAGAAVGSPIAGVAIDRCGPAGGFGAVAILAVVVAAGGVLVQRAGRRVLRY